MVKPTSAHAASLPAPADDSLAYRALTKWYSVAQSALAHNRPLAMPLPGRKFNAEEEVAFSQAEQKALHSVGALLGEKDRTIAPDEDPLLKTQAQYMAALEESLSAQQAAKLLKVDVSRVRQRLRERSLFGLEYEGSWRLPRFQFERHLALPGLAQILKALPKDLFPLDVVDWFLLPNADLELDKDEKPLSPRDWLVAGRPVETVVALAAAFEGV